MCSAALTELPGNKDVCATARSSLALDHAEVWLLFSLLVTASSGNGSLLQVVCPTAVWGQREGLGSASYASETSVTALPAGWRKLVGCSQHESQTSRVCLGCAGCGSKSSSSTQRSHNPSLLPLPQLPPSNGTCGGTEAAQLGGAPGSR